MPMIAPAAGGVPWPVAAARSRTAAAVAGGCTRPAGGDGGPASTLGSMIAALAAAADSAAPTIPHRTRRRDLGTAVRRRDLGTLARPGTLPASRPVAISA